MSLSVAQLSKFSAHYPNQRSPFIDRPFRFNGYIYASDGRLCIRIKDEGILPVENAPIGMPDLEQRFGRDNCSLPIPELPPKIECDACDGTALNHEIDCDACDGDGVLISGGECTKCGSAGTIYLNHPMPNAGPCWYCDGRGETTHNPVKIGDAHFNRVFLNLLSDLPNIRFTYVARDEAACLVFDGGEAILMPVRGVRS